MAVGDSLVDIFVGTFKDYVVEALRGDICDLVARIEALEECNRARAGSVCVRGRRDGKEAPNVAAETL